MSGFLSKRLSGLVPYVPGEQPRGMQRLVKLNTNENPFPPPPSVVQAASAAAAGVERYCDPEARELTGALALLLGVAREQIVVGNGSDEVLEFAFRAWGDDERPAAFADVTYGFYPVFAAACGVPYEEVSLREDLSLDLGAYGTGERKLFVFANPNAPTGIALPPEEFVSFAQANPESVVVVDEAYVDFGARSCVDLLGQAENLVAVQTFSKSRSMAGARFGFAVGSPALMADLQTIRYSSNPYNVNACTQAAARAMLACEDEMRERCARIAATRDETAARLARLGFETTDSKTNFIFARHERAGGAELYAALKERGILVRHFDKPRIAEYLRITVGTDGQMAALTAALEDILGTKEERDA